MFRRPSLLRVILGVTVVAVAAYGLRHKQDPSTGSDDEEERRRRKELENEDGSRRESQAASRRRQQSQSQPHSAHTLGGQSDSEERHTVGRKGTTGQSCRSIVDSQAQRKHTVIGRGAQDTGGAQPEQWPDADELRNHPLALQEHFSNLSTFGRKIQQALGDAMRASVRFKGGTVLVERALKECLARALPQAEVERVGTAQWKVVIDDEAYFASVRCEVLDSPEATGGFLADLKEEARMVKRTLLADDAQRLKQLGQGMTRNEFLQECKNFAALQPNSLESCSICSQPFTKNQHAGTHKCKVYAEFLCRRDKTRWTSMQARYDPGKQRVLGQKCKLCDVFGECVKWSMLDPQASQREFQNTHRSDLCESCNRFGNCQGAFFDPFIIAAALDLVVDTGKPVRWREPNGCSGGMFVAQAAGHQVAILMHIFDPNVLPAAARRSSGPSAPGESDGLEESRPTRSHTRRRRTRGGASAANRFAGQWGAIDEEWDEDDEAKGRREQRKDVPRRRGVGEGAADVDGPPHPQPPLHVFQ